jgi:hypothetical protein
LLLAAWCLLLTYCLLLLRAARVIVHGVRMRPCPIILVAVDQRRGDLLLLDLIKSFPSKSTTAR